MRKYWIGVGASIILGLMFFTAGLGKLLHQTAIPEIYFMTLPSFATPALIEAFFSWLPRIELIVGLLLIIGIAAKLVAVFSSALIAGFIANNSWLLIHGLGEIPCGCFGIVEEMVQIRLSATVSLYLDIAALALVSIILSCYKSGFFNVNPWFTSRGKN